MHEEVAFFDELRRIARERTKLALNRKILAFGGAATWDATTLASISNEAVDYAESIWRGYYGTTTHLGFVRRWSSIWAHAKLQPSNFNVAVWQSFEGRDVLQGIATGTRSHGNAHLTLNWVERNFGPEYSRFGVLIPILMCFEEYARLLDVDRVLIKNPVDPSKYEKYGYKLFNVRKSKTVFLGKELRDD